MKITETLAKMDIPCVYSHSKNGLKTPYIAYIGSGQNQFKADNHRYNHNNTYQVEYYFKAKNEELESSIEEIIDGDGWQFEKSEDIFIEDENVFLIYYYLS